MSLMCKDIINHLEKLAPEGMAEDWDNVGLQVGGYGKSVDKVLITLDVTKDVIDMAITEGVDLIISHHPLIFKGIKNVTMDNYLGNNLQKLIKHDISVYSMHTNMDISKHGIATKLAEMLDLKHITILCETKEYKGVAQGHGRVGELPHPISFETLANTLKTILKCDMIRYAGNQKEIIKKVALCPGSGMDFMQFAKNVNADVYITGDLKYHQAVEVNEMDFLVIDAEHFYTEKIFEEIVYDYMEDYVRSHKVDIIGTFLTESPIKYM